jgi:hypothetical protein
LPGTVQAENFDEGGQDVAYHDSSPAQNSGGLYRQTGVDLEATTDSGGGYSVGWVSAGEWLNYTVNVGTAGTYTIEARVASAGAGGTFHIEANGIALTTPLTVPDTGAWQTWTTLSRTGVSLASGTQILRLVMDTAGPGGAVGNFNWLRAIVPTTGSTPYTGTPVALPGTFEAEDFDEGGADVAYHDSSAQNSGGMYRQTGVDIEPTTDTGGGYNVGWVTAGEWLNYSVSVATPGSYTIAVRVAAPGIGGSFHVEAKGITLADAVAVPDTGSWQTWTTVTRTVSLTTGTQILRLVMDTDGVSGAVGNFNWVRVTPATTGSTPYTGTPVALPGTVQAENFDEGGQDVAYHDNSPAQNSGGMYRQTGVDLESTTDSGGGYDVGWVSAGEWLNYTVSVSKAGTYTLEVRVASPGVGGTFHIEANGIALTAPIPVPDTGGWQAWTTVTRAGVALAAGTQVLRVVMDTVGASSAVGNFNWVRITSAE